MIRILLYALTMIAASAGIAAFLSVLEVFALGRGAGAQALDFGLGRLAADLAPESLLATSQRFSNTLCEYHFFEKPGALTALMKASAAVNALLGAVAGLLAAPLFCLSRAAHRLDTPVTAAAANGWVVGTTGVAYHVLDLSFWKGAGVESWVQAASVGALAVALALAILFGGVVSRFRTGIRAVTAAAVVLGAAAIFWSVPAAPFGGHERPNVLLVSIDSLRSDHLHAYGYPKKTSPTMDALAAEGALFTQFVSPASWTLPAHVTLLTSMAPHHHGVNNDGKKIDGSAITLPELFANAGYGTAGFVSGHYLHPQYGYPQGFESYDHGLLATGDLQTQRTSPYLVEAVRKWLSNWRDHDSERPFFIFLHMFDVHYDFNPPAPYDSMFDPGYEGPVDGLDFFDSDLYHKDMDPRDLRHLLALYDGEIRYTDDHLALIIETLEEMGVLDNTIVAVTADHGDEFFEHGRKGHRMTLFEEVVRIPLIIRYPPKVPAGVRVKPQARLMDVGPTILSLAGVPSPPGFGPQPAGEMYRPRDLTPWMERRPVQPKIISFGDLHSELWSVRTERVKMVLFMEGDYEMLYDLHKDPTEQKNIAGAQPGAVDLLKERLLSFANPEDAPILARPHQEDEKQLENLRRLGYIR